MRISLPTPQQFSLPAVLRSHGWIQLAPFASGDPYHDFTYVDQLANGRVVAWQVQPAPDGIQVSVGAPLSDDEAAEVRNKLSWMLNLERDLAPFYTIARQEPKLAHVIEKGEGRILRSPTIFEDTVKTILTTNTAWSGTRRMVSALVDLYGKPLLGDPARRAFPRAEALAAADPGALRDEAKLGYRAPYVSELARRIAAGELDLEAYKSADLSTLELRKELLAIKGVGPYAAANLLMLLGRTDYIPIDSYALKVVSNEFHDGQPVSPADVSAAFERFDEWQGMAFWFWNYD
jgi:3-methyladenine DNA glycosylase/8-oxoguanine DNA glycosylase